MMIIFFYYYIFFIFCHDTYDTYNYNIDEILEIANRSSREIDNYNRVELEVQKIGRIYLGDQ